MPVTTSDVLKAIAEFDTLGRADFLAAYGFKPSREYVLRHEGKEYDSKPIWAVAHKWDADVARPLRFDEFSGGAADAVKKLQALGFEVVKEPSNPDWTWDEHVLALELYMRDPTTTPGHGSKEVLELSALLNALARRSGLVGNDRFRNPNGVYMKLMNFRRLDPAVLAEGKKGLSQGAAGEERVWNAYAGKLDELRVRAAAIRLAIDDTEVDLVPAADDYEAEEGGVILRLHKSRERDRKLIAKKKAQVLAQTGKLACEPCGFDFQEAYGDAGEGFIEAHHRKPVSTLKKGEKTRLADLALVCANCHRVLHKRGLMAVEDLAKLIGVRRAPA